MQFDTNVSGNSIEHPTALLPLGVQFPGYTHLGEALPNWVGHLISKYCPEPRFNPDGAQKEAWLQSPLLVYDYARRGDTVDGIQRQISSVFLPEAKSKLDQHIWRENEALFGECSAENQV